LAQVGGGEVEGVEVAVESWRVARCVEAGLVASAAGGGGVARLRVPQRQVGGTDVPLNGGEPGEGFEGRSFEVLGGGVHGVDLLDVDGVVGVAVGSGCGKLRGLRGLREGFGDLGRGFGGMGGWVETRSSTRNPRNPRNFIGFGVELRGLRGCAKN
jgi:hypothetical protein